MRSRLPAAVLVVVLAALAAGNAAAQERFRRTPPLPDPEPMELRLPKVETLLMANGLTVATARRPEAHLATLQLVVRAGEADSPPDRPAVGALTARMIGKGTKMLSSDYLEDMIESLGASFSAAVLMDYTVFTVHILPEHLDRAIFALRLMALEAVFTERELGAVRRDALSELFEQRRNPEVLGWRRLLGTLFESHPYRAATSSEEAVKLVATRDVAAFYARYYRPGNSAVLVSGNIDAADAAKKVESHFGGWAGRPVERAAVEPPPANGRDRVCFVEAPDLDSATIFAGNVIMNSSDPDFFPFLVLKQVLGGTTRSRLFMNLRESKGYAYYAFSETEFFRSCGVYWARARVRPEFIAPAVREIVREIGALAANPAVPSEIEEAKSFLIGNLPMRFESIEGFSDWMARYVALGLDEAHWDKGSERFKLVDVARVQETARKSLAARPVVVVVGRPEWIGLYLGSFDLVEVYDMNGELRYKVVKGEGP
jgi:zinc protease